MSNAALPATPSPDARHWTAAFALASAAHIAVLATQIHWPDKPSVPMVETGATFLPPAAIPRTSRQTAAQIPKAAEAAASLPARQVQPAVEAVDAAVAANMEPAAVVASQLETPEAVGAKIPRPATSSIEIKPASAAPSIATGIRQTAPVSSPAVSPITPPDPASTSRAQARPVPAAPMPSASLSAETAQTAKTVAVTTTPRMTPPVSAPAAIVKDNGAVASAVAVPSSKTAASSQAVVSAPKAIAPAPTQPGSAVVAAAAPALAVTAPAVAAAKPVTSLPGPPQPAPSPVQAGAPPVQTALAVPETPPAPASAVVPDIDIDAEIAAVAQAFVNEEPCARMGSPQVTASADGRLIEGIVTSDASVARLRENLAAIEGAPEVDLAVQVVDLPFCQALLALPVAVEGVESMQLNREDGLYLDGELLALEVGPIPVGGQLYVTFVDHDGSVQHLVPSQFEEETAVRAGDVRELGAEQDILDVLEALGISVGNWRATEPFGRGLIMAFVTSSLLEPAPPVEIVPAEGYFDYLDEATRNNPVLWARYRWIDTRPNP